jgi:hypothetical protein
MTDTAVARAADILSIRERRAEHFPSELFDEHAWDLMLYLFVAAHRGGDIHQASLSSMLRVRAAVFERWIKVLVEDSVVEVRGDHLSLTESSTIKMEALLAE